MKATGIVRKIDDLGRIVIPIETRRAMDIEVGDGMEIFVDGEKIVLKKHNIGCDECGEAGERLFKVGKGFVCGECLLKSATAAGIQVI